LQQVEKLEAAMPVYNIILMKIIGVRVGGTSCYLSCDQLNYVPIILETLRSFGNDQR
jgi:hypothetical protein